jgi:predicted transcriptional regulator
MSNKEPTTDAITPKERPPFNEVSVLFPLLSIYTAGYMGLMIADALNISRATAGRLLVRLETKGLIVRKGEGKGSYYILAAPSTVS